MLCSTGGDPACASLHVGEGKQGKHYHFLLIIAPTWLVEQRTVLCAEKKCATALPTTRGTTMLAHRSRMTSLCGLASAESRSRCAQGPIACIRHGALLGTMSMPHRGLVHSLRCKNHMLLQWQP